MALIPCPYCGKEISSYAKKCPSCGSDLTNTPAPKPAAAPNDVICRECGTHYDKNAEACPNCGEPNINFKATSSTQNLNITVDYNKIFHIKDDEFEGRKVVYTEYDMSGNEYLDRLAEQVGATKPCIDIMNITDSDGCNFYIRYDERDLLEELGNNERREASEIESPCKGIIINIDTGENIKLGADYFNNGIATFPINQEELLRCCNAKNLSFKIFKEDGAPIIIHGTKEDTDLMIASFQAMYSYIIDNKSFPDAAVKLQQWQNDMEKKYTAMEQENNRRQAEMEQMEQDKGSRNVTIGSIIAGIGVILFIVGVADFLELFWLVILGVIGVLVGAAFIIFGVLKKRGYDDDAAWEKVAEIFKNIKFK